MEACVVVSCGSMNIEQAVGFFILTLHATAAAARLRAPGIARDLGSGAYPRWLSECGTMGDSVYNRRLNAEG